MFPVTSIEKRLLQTGWLLISPTSLSNANLIKFWRHVQLSSVASDSQPQTRQQITECKGRGLMKAPKDSANSLSPRQRGSIATKDEEA